MLFKSTRAIIEEIDSFLNTVSESALVFTAGLKDYMNSNQEGFQLRIKTITELEAIADQLRRSIENNLYSHSLLPEHRGNVLRLVEQFDEIIDTAKEVYISFDVEKPIVPEQIRQHYLSLSEMACQAVDNVVKSARTYFSDPKHVKDHLHKVYFYEKEADKLSDLLKRLVFSDENLHLSEKNHLRYFINRIDMLADTAERVADMLAIYAIKQTI